MKRTVLGITAVVAVAGTAVAVPAIGQSQTPGGRTITLTSRTSSVKFVDLAPRSRASAGDVLVSVSRLEDSQGKRVGTSWLNCGVAQGSSSVEGALYQCVGTHKLKDGTLTFGGVARLGSAKVIRVAVTGGTGAYDGARGELVNTASGEDVSTQVVSLRD